MNMNHISPYVIHLQKRTHAKTMMKSQGAPAHSMMKNKMDFFNMDNGLSDQKKILCVFFFFLQDII